MNAMRFPEKAVNRFTRPLQRFLAAALIAGGAGGIAQAEQDAPINIEADKADIHQSSMVYTGSVRITQGSIALSGDKLTVTRLPRAVAGSEDQFELVLTGQPAKVVQEPGKSGGEPISGQAALVQYQSSSAVLELRGNAVLHRGGEAITGETIQYDWRARRTRVNTGGKGRVSITLQPGGKNQE